MIGWGRARTAAAAGLAGACLLLVALAATARPTGATGAPRVTSLGAAGDVVGAVFLVAGAGTVVLIVWALWPSPREASPRGRGRRRRTGVPWWRRLAEAVVPGVVAVAVVVLALLAIVHRRRGPGVVAGAGAALAGRGLAGHVARHHAQVSLGSAAIVAIAAGGLALVLIALAAVASHRRRAARRRGTGPADETIVEPGLGAVATRALAELGSEADPRRAILAAYRALEEGVVVPSARRAPAEAPLEFRDRLVAAGAPPGPAGRLTDLFEVARFSDHVVGAPDRDEAVAALERLRPAGGEAP